MTKEEFEKLSPEERARVIAFGIFKPLLDKGQKFAEGGIRSGPPLRLMEGGERPKDIDKGG